MKLSEPGLLPRALEWQGIHLTYDVRRARFLPESADVTPDLLAHATARVLISWDLERNEGGPFPITRAALLSLGHGFLLSLCTAIMHDYNTWRVVLLRAVLRKGG